MPTHFLPDATGRTERPGVIAVFGLLSFINCGIFLIVYALVAMAMVAFQSMPLEEVTAAMHEGMAQYSGMFSEEQLAQVDEIVPILHANGVTVLLLLLGRTVARLIGAIGIWKGRRSGYFTYATAQVAGIFLPHLVLPLKYLGIFGPLMAVAMCVIYGTQLKRMQ